MGLKIPYMNKVLFADTPEPTPPKEEKAPARQEIGYARTDLYGAGINAYDPDDLKIKKGNNVYQEMNKDDQVKPVIQFKKDAVLSRNWYFEPGVDEDGAPREDHKEMADFFTFMIGAIKGSFTDKLQGIFTSLENGFSISEKVFKSLTYQERTMWGIKDIKLRPFDSFEGGFVTDKHGNIEGLEQSIPGAVVTIPLDKVIHFVNDPQHDAIYGQSELRACYRAWWSKDITIRFQNIFLERYASGHITATVEGDLSVSQRAALQNLLKNVSTETGMIVPSNVSLDQIMPSTTDAYERAVAQHDKAIAKSVLVPNLLGITEQGSTGSYSQSETQLRAFFWTLGALAKRLEETLDEQLFRQLALWNFGTDDYPKFKFQPMTAEQAVEISQVWGDLVQKGAVTNSETDEAYIRNILGFPEKTEEDEDVIGDELPEGESVGDGEVFDPEAVDPGTALNGAQVAALLDIIAKMGSGELDKKTAIKLIAAAFPMSIEEAGTLLSEVQEGKIKIPEGIKEGFTLNDLREFADKSTWFQRMDFQQVEGILDDNDEKFADMLSNEQAQARFKIEGQIRKVAKGRSGGNIKATEFELGVNYPKAVHTAIVKTSRVNLKETMEDGVVSARRNLPKQNNTEIHVFQLDTKARAESFLSSRAMNIGKDLDADTMKAVNNVLLNGIKYDWSVTQIMDALASDTKLTELWPDYEIVERVGKPPIVRAINKPARLATLVRTTNAEAFNEARDAFFKAPENKGFVVAFEYSAILDNRTTDICNKLDGNIRRDFGRYAPPNHFNCRSLLIPITILDDWDGKQTPFPSTQPQEGFGNI